MSESSTSHPNDTELTMCDVLQEEQALEDDANAVLGGSDDTNCSYDKGYVPRQALYACKTCSCDGQEAGVCLACCYACHDGHEVVELYTKRHFRCDCGNYKFGDKKCILRPGKESENALNRYNHNFKGLYCRCERPYPDLEDDTPDEMIQCVFCEDWYHGRHLSVAVPDDYFEMICEQCMRSHAFLYKYLGKYNVVVDVERSPRKSPRISRMSKESTNDQAMSSSETCANVTETDIKAEDSAGPTNNAAESDSKLNIKLEDKTIADSENGLCSNAPDMIKPIDVKTESTVESIKNDIKPVDVKPESNAESIKNEILNGDSKNDCKLQSLCDPHTTTGSAFWPENWRNDLCRCVQCVSLYKASQCEFLLDTNDTIQAYEERGKGRSGQSQYDKGLDALSQLDRVKQMEAVRAYTSMKGQLKEYLKEFADNKRTVCESDIKEFFERMGKKKKLNNGIPHFCR